MAQVSVFILGFCVLVALLSLKSKSSLVKSLNEIEYAGKSAADAQAAQYPDIKPIDSSLGKSEAFNRALEVTNDMGLEIVFQDSETGIIEAIASTRFFNIKDDVIIRVSENGAKSIVDIRSHSRIGRGDRGKNAERVRSFITQF